INFHDFVYTESLQKRIKMFAINGLRNTSRLSGVIARTYSNSIVSTPPQVKVSTAVSRGFSCQIYVKLQLYSTTSNDQEIITLLYSEKLFLFFFIKQCYLSYPLEITWNITVLKSLDNFMKSDNLTNQINLRDIIENNIANLVNLKSEQSKNLIKK
ncbi:hypothetical protein ALC56_00991, partial [Trachymyrmex septentrionalis]